MEDIKPKKQHLENLRSILSVGEPLNAEAVIWVKNFGFPIMDKLSRRYYDNYPSMKVKPVPWENLCLG
jgi:acetyl-CoA synthetase